MESIVPFSLAHVLKIVVAPPRFALSSSRHAPRNSPEQSQTFFPSHLAQTPSRFPDADGLSFAQIWRCFSLHICPDAPKQ